MLRNFQTEVDEMIAECECAEDDQVDYKVPAGAALPARGAFEGTGALEARDTLLPSLPKVVHSAL